MVEDVKLVKFAWLSVGTGIVVFSLKLAAWAATGSVGLLSDALESIVNIVAAVIATFALYASARPGDERHHFGRGKAEYFSAQIEGFMILVAAILIVYTAVERILHPVAPENGAIGVGVSILATGLNGFVALLLIRKGKEYRSPVLDADGRHLMTDVWTSVGVVVGVGLVYLTHWNVLDALVALAVGLNIIVTGVNLLRESTRGLLDRALSQEDHDTIAAILKKYEREDFTFHALQTREAGRTRFISMHVLVPGAWTVEHGHNIIEEIEAELVAALPGAVVHTHMEPIEDPRAWEDQPPGQFIWNESAN